MGKNLLVINVDIRETRVALIENGIIAELHLERETQKGTLGNIYLGKVSRVLPGMQAAFIDVGLERAAFLHVEDLIRPDDFEAYLAGHRRGGGHDEVERETASPARGEGRAPSRPEEPLPAEPPEVEVDVPIELPTALEVMSGEESDAFVAEDAGTVDDEEAFVRSAEAQEEPQEDEEEPEGAVQDESVAPVTAPDEPSVAAALEVSGAEPALAMVPAPEDAAMEASQRAPRSRGKRPAQAREGRVRRSGRTRDRRAVPGAVSTPNGPTKDASGGGRHAKDRGTSKPRQHEPPRVSKATPIREVVREGQEVIVQVSKEPIGTKGARVTSHVSLPGRYVVYLPTVDHIGVSKRIGSEKERQRLRESIDAMKPPQGGLIVRTLAEGLTKKQLKADVGYLVRLWGEVAKKRESGVRAPACLYTELDLVLKTARDLFTDDIEKIVIDNRDEYIRLKRFVEMFMPERAEAVELYEGEEPIFDAYGIEDEIQRALSRKVPLPSGGHLIIDQAEALTAIDVNTGRFVGKGSKDLEETILRTNLEAVEEIAYQLRFRNIGGLIILDLIDMERANNREKVRKRMEELLARDKAKTTLNRISDLGLIEMTRKRTRESLGRTVLEPCFYCDGTGQLQSKQTVAYEILRQIRRERMNLPGYSILVNAHPAVIDLLKNEERIAVQEAERMFTRRIELVPRKEYHLEQFDVQGK
jgi:ribonuclease G